MRGEEEGKEGGREGGKRTGEESKGAGENRERRREREWTKAEGVGERNGVNSNQGITDKVPRSVLLSRHLLRHLVPSTSTTGVLPSQNRSLLYPPSIPPIRSLTSYPVLSLFSLTFYLLLDMAVRVVCAEHQHLRVCWRQHPR